MCPAAVRNTDLRPLIFSKLAGPSSSFLARQGGAPRDTSNDIKIVSPRSYRKPALRNAELFDRRVANLHRITDAGLRYLDDPSGHDFCHRIGPVRQMKRFKRRFISGRKSINFFGAKNLALE